MNILLVDDHKLIRDALKSYMDDDDEFEVVDEAENGQEALILLKTLKVDVVMLDISMPVMDGIEFVKLAKESTNCKFVPIVMLSSEEDEAKISEARKAGVSTFMKKPINEAQFTAMVKIVLGSASS